MTPAREPRGVEASAVDRRMPRSAHQDHVPEAMLPITIPAIVPAVRR